jgi:hypothetical protein
MDKDVLDLSEKELAGLLIETTNQLVYDRVELLNLQKEHMKAKMELKSIDTSLLQQIATNPQFKNDRARDSELAARQRTTPEYKQWLTTRNLCWIKVQQQEIQIELDNNEIKNLRVMLKQ